MSQIRPGVHDRSLCPSCTAGLVGTEESPEDGEDPEAEVDKETIHRLCPTYATDINSPLRHVRTRIYFTSESHVHSLLNVLRYSHLAGQCTFIRDHKALDRKHDMRYCDAIYAFYEEKLRVCLGFLLLLYTGVRAVIRDLGCKQGLGLIPFTGLSTAISCTPARPCSLAILCCLWRPWVG